jgi:glycosyltransferase involved in cell wall biosynthesis
MKLSAVIITLNEEKNLGRCLDSLVGLADEIIVVDSFSSDKTSEIALRYGAIFILNKFEGHIQQKNFALQQAQGDWILSLDADEALDKDLIASIKQVISDENENLGYTMNRLTNYCGKWIRHCGWYPDTKLRLVRNGKAEWRGVNPHDKLELTDALPPGHLKGDILHYSYYTMEDHYKQIEYFGSIAAKEMYSRGKKVPRFTSIIKTAAQFFKSFFLKLGILDGIAGWNISIRSAYATHRKYALLRDAWNNHERK